MTRQENGGFDATADYLRVLLRCEGEVYPPFVDYLEQGEKHIGEDMSICVNEAWRQKLAEWSFQVVDYFGYEREVVSIAVNYLDRFAAIRSDSEGLLFDKRDYQLFAVTSLYIALKIHGGCEDVSRPKLRIEAFEELSRGRFDPQAIAVMETEILSTLDWLLHPPTCLLFLHSILQLFPKERKDEETFVLIANVARYIAELSVCASVFSFKFKASTVAFASTVCAIENVRSSAPSDSDKCFQTFYESMQDTTGLHLDNQEVQHACTMMRGLFPDVLQVGSPCSHSEDDSLVSSPVCVIVQAGDEYRANNSPVQFTTKPPETTQR